MYATSRQSINFQDVYDLSIQQIIQILITSLYGIIENIYLLLMLTLESLNPRGIKSRDCSYFRVFHYHYIT